MPNYDEETGIRYGIISPHSISGFALDDVYSNGIDPIYEAGKTELLKDIEAFCEDHNISFEDIDTDSFIDAYSNGYGECGDGQCDYSDNDYTLHVSGDNFGIYVIKSPYYTFCRGCSPCAPGAGDLDNPSDDGEKTYCLDKSWFDDEKVPYRVYRVDTDEEII